MILSVEGSCWFKGFRDSLSAKSAHIDLNHIWISEAAYLLDSWTQLSFSRALSWDLFQLYYRKCLAGDAMGWTWDLLHSNHALCHWAEPPPCLVFILSSTDFTQLKCQASGSVVKKRSVVFDYSSGLSAMRQNGGSCDRFGILLKQCKLSIIDFITAIFNREPLWYSG